MRWMTAILLLAAATWVSPPAHAQSSPTYLLSPAEIERFRGEAGGFSNIVAHRDAEQRGPLWRVIRNVTGALHGKVVGGRGPILELFYNGINGPPEKLSIERERFLVGAATRHQSRSEGAIYIIDMKTGHVAVGVNYPARPYQEWFKDGKAVLVTKDCANADLRDFAAERYRRWIETEYKRAPNEYAMLPPMTTRCASASKPK